MGNMLTIKEVAEVLNLGYLQTRIYLGDPDDYTVTANGKQKYLYTLDHVSDVKDKVMTRRAEKLRNKGKRKCYYCGAVSDKERLTSGICVECQAHKLVKNFVCHGDYTTGKIDTDRLESIASALHNLQTNIAQRQPQTVPTV